MAVEIIEGCGPGCNCWTPNEDEWLAHNEMQCGCPDGDPCLVSEVLDALERSRR